MSETVLEIAAAGESHRNYVHPQCSKIETISGKTGNDAPKYQIKQSEWGDCWGEKQMRKEADLYKKVVYWSDEDNCFIGMCFELIYGGVHGDDVLGIFKDWTKLLKKLSKFIEKTEHLCLFRKKLFLKQLESKGIYDVLSSIFIWSSGQDAERRIYVFERHIFGGAGFRRNVFSQSGRFGYFIDCGLAVRSRYWNAQCCWSAARICRSLELLVADDFRFVGDTVFYGDCDKTQEKAGK